MDWSSLSDYPQAVEFQLSLLRVASPGEPPSRQAMEVERLLDHTEIAREPLH
jgi:hypothetical protein